MDLSANDRYLCCLHFKAPCWNKSHILKWNSYSYTCTWIVVLTPKWCMMPKRYLEWPMVFDTHYPGITRTRQAWTYFPFPQYNLNKGLHYSGGILRRSLGLICPGLHPWVSSQLPGLLHVPVKASALSVLLNNKHDLSCHWEWPAAQTGSPRGSFVLTTVRLRANQSVSDWAGYKSF